MLPIGGPVYGVFLAAASRMARGEVDVSEGGRDQLEKTRERVDEISELVGDLSPDKPSSWARFAGRVIDRALDKERRYDSVQDAVDARGYDDVRLFPSAVVEWVGRRADGQILVRDDGKKLWAAELQPGVEVGIELNSSSKSASRIHWRTEEVSERRVVEAMSELIWKDDRALMVGWSNGEATIRPLQLQRFQYYGEQLELIDWIDAFRSRGMRRNVLLQGPPGSGKTTLCCHAARELSDRSVQFASDAVSQMQLEEWTALLSLLNPEVAIVDDIDRLERRRGGDLEQKLRFFEEGYCEVPVVLFTSNDYTRIPAAMRRPGRIDRFVEFDEPDDHMRRRILERLADDQDVELPEDQIPKLMHILENYSPAHVLEAIRRGAVTGWEDGEATYEEFRFQREYDGVDDWLRLHGYRRMEVRPEFVFEEVERRCAAELTFESDLARLFRYELSNGARLVVERHPGGGRSNRYYRPDIDGEDEFRRGMAGAFWSARSAVMLDAIASNDFRCQPVELTGNDYYGPLVELIEKWRRFRELGIRRNVLLQGPPGCGKSTFCMHAARELSDRTLVLTPDFYDQIRCGEWRTVVDLLDPQMVVVDDVDRVSDHTLESKLRLFEEGYCDVPFVLMTSNDHEKLPRPMRRPGRIDRIIEVDPPDKKLRWKLIRQMARREKLDEVPEQHLKMLDRVLQRQSTAHLVELLRRARALGWEEAMDPIKSDATFDLEIDEKEQSLVAGR